jgi:hypothetical protein
MMTKSTNEFTDTCGRTWKIKLDYATIERVRDDHGLNFNEILANQGELWLTLQADPMALIDAVAALCAPAISLAGLSDQEFKAGLSDGETIDAVWEAFNAALQNFYPRHQREALVALRTKLEELRQGGLELMRGTTTDQIVAAIKSTNNGSPNRSGEPQTSGSRD